MVSDLLQLPKIIPSGDVDSNSFARVGVLECWSNGVLVERSVSFLHYSNNPSLHYSNNYKYLDFR
jgi:hypothetical protein